MTITASPLAAALVEAQRSGIPVAAAGLPAPASFEAAGAIQAEVAAALGAEIAGWKVGMAPDGETPVAAPIFAHLVLDDGARYDFGAASLAAIEVEIGFRLTADAGGGPLDAALGSAFVGVEVVRSRLAEGPGAPFATFLADNIANGAYIVGPERADWRDLDLATLTCRVWRDGTLVHDAPGGHPQTDPLVPLRRNWAPPPRQLGGLRAGQFVTTGTFCGVMRIERPCRIRAEIAPFGAIELDLSGR